MPHYTPPLRDMQFVMHEVLNAVDELKALPAHADIDADTINAVLEEGGKFASTVLAPLNQSGDEEGCTLDRATHAVMAPKGFKEAYAQYVAGEAAVQVTNVRNAPHHRLAVQLEHQTQHAVCRRMLRSNIDEHVVAREIRLDSLRRLHGHHVAGLVGNERHSTRFAVRVQAGGRELDFDRALDGGHYSPVLSPVPRRRRISSGKSSNACAMESSSIE